MGEPGGAICVGNFKDVFCFTFCYNEVNANCFVCLKLFFLVLEGDNKESEWVLAMACNVMLVWHMKKQIQQMLVLIHCCVVGSYTLLFFKFYLDTDFS